MLSDYEELIQETNHFHSRLSPKIISLFLLFTGVFAFFGSLYSWGSGFIFLVPAGPDFILIITDLIITAPISLIASYNLWNQRKWCIYLNWLVAGLYIYGSTAVYVMLFQQGPPFQAGLLLPPIFGFGFSFILIIWSLNNKNYFK